MKHNVIPRKFECIIAECMVGNAKGERMRITRDYNGLHGVDENGQNWLVFPSHLRNPELYKIIEVKKGA